MRIKYKLKTTTSLCIITVLSCFFHLNSFSQDEIWNGYGKGLSHISISKDQILMQTYRDPFELKYDYINSGNGDKLLYMKENDFYEYKGSIKAYFKDLNEDSLIVTYKADEFLFVREEVFTIDNPIKFESFVYEHLGAMKNTIEKISFNKFGTLRKSNSENLTILEVKVDENEVEEFLSILSKIDIRNIYLTDRWMNDCDNEELSFTFIDNSKFRYNYTSILTRKNLEPITSYLELLLDKYKSN